MTKPLYMKCSLFMVHIQHCPVRTVVTIPREYNQCAVINTGNWVNSHKIYYEYLNLSQSSYLLCLLCFLCCNLRGRVPSYTQLGWHTPQSPPLLTLPPLSCESLNQITRVVYTSSIARTHIYLITNTLKDNGGVAPTKFAAHFVSWLWFVKEVPIRLHFLQVNSLLLPVFKFNKQIDWKVIHTHDLW